MKKILFSIILLVTFILPFKVNAATGITDASTLKTQLQNGGDFRLDADITLTTNSSVNNTTTLDLNGHTLNMSDKTLIINGTTTVKDTSSNGKITSSAMFTVQVGSSSNSTATLKVLSGTIQGTSEYGAIRNYGNTEIDGGTVKANSFTIYNQNNLRLKSGTIIVRDYVAVQVYENSTFTMDGGLITFETNTSDDGGLVNLYGDCSATINNGTIDASAKKGAGITVYKNTNLTVNGGTITGDDCAIMGNGALSGNSQGTNANITINGGTLTSLTGSGIYLPQANSEHLITGGTITGVSGVEIRSGKLTITGGSLNSNCDTYEIINNNNGNTTYGAGIAIAQHVTKQPIEVIINGGSFNAPAPYSEANPANNPIEDLQKINVTINQGDFNKTGEESVEAAYVRPFIKGGTYDNDVSDLVDDDYGVVQIDNQYEVNKKYRINIENSSKDYIIMNDNRYPYKGTVTLDVDDQAIVEIRDESGNRIDVRGKTFVMPEGNVSLRIINTNILNPRTNHNYRNIIAILLITIIGFIVLLVLNSKNKEQYSLGE